MTNRTFNVFLGGTGEKLGVNSDYEVAKALCTLLKPKDGIEYVDYVFYDGVDTKGDHHRYPITPVPNALGNVGALLLGEGSDNIRDSVVSLVSGVAEPFRLLGMITEQKKHPRKTDPVNFRNLSEEGASLLINDLTLHQSLTEAEAKQISSLIAAIHRKQIAQVNLVGWSRGGVNALRIAHELYKYDRRIAVNILDFDPVPGPTNHTLPTLLIPPNVRDYVSLVAKNEYRIGFIPEIPAAEHPSTIREIYTVPGTHDTLMGNQGGNGDPSTIQSPLGRRVYAFAHQKLLEWVATAVPLEADLQAHQDWEEIYANRAALAQPVINSIVSNEIQIPNYKEVKEPDGSVQRFRMVQVEDRGYLYMDAVPAFHCNPSNARWDGFFGLVPEICTLQRDYNDHQLARNFESKIETLDNKALDYQGTMASIFIYLLNRYQVNGLNEILLPAIMKVKAKLHVDSIFLAALLDQPKDILVHQPFLNYRDTADDTALMIAARYGNMKALNQLLDLDADVNLANHDHTALDVAARYGQLEAVKALFAKYEIEQQINALVFAAKYQQHAVVKYLANSIDLAHPSLCAHAQVHHLKMWAVEQEDLKLLKAVVTNSHLELKALQVHAEVMKKTKTTEVIGHSTTGATGKPFFTTARSIGTAGCVLGLGYAASVLTLSLAPVHYPSLVNSIFVASSFGAPVALVALFLTFAVIFAAGIMTSYYHHDNQVTPTPALRA